MVVADAVKHLPSGQRYLSGRYHLYIHGSARGQGSILEQHGSCHRSRCFEMAQMVRRIKAVQGPLSKLVEVEVVPLHGVVNGAQHEHTRPRAGSHHVVHNARATIKQLLGREPRGGFGHGGPGGHGGAQHPASGYPHAEGVGNHSLLEADFAAVGEARDHAWVLAPLLRKARLGGRVPIGVVQAFDVAAQHGLHANTLHEAR